MNPEVNGARVSVTPSATRIIGNNHRNENPMNQDNSDSVEEFKSNQLLRLSTSSRTAILEESHGVRCLAPDETPEMIDEALAKLAAEIDKLPTEEKSAYIMSQQSKEMVFPDGAKASSDFVNSDDFRLRFLRAELFDASKAAKRLAKFLDVGLDFFGTKALFRPPKFSDYTKSEQQMARNGSGHWLPFRDRHGRRVFFVIMDDQMEGIPQHVRMKILYYMMWHAGTHDVELQRKGVVVVMWCQDIGFSQLKVTPDNSNVQMDDFAPMRVSSMHICTPDTPFFRFAQRIWSIMVGTNIASRIHIHVGEPVELRYALESHGICTDQIPVTWTGTAKTSYTRQWFRLRHLIDECSDDSSIVECPNLDDVIFRQGTSTASHPGNALFRSRIQLFFEESEAHTTARTTRSLVSKLMHDIRERNGRVLVWYQEKNKITRNIYSYWIELTDEAQVFTKIENLVREFKFAKGRHHAINRGESGMARTGGGSVQVAESSTTLFLSGQDRTNNTENKKMAGAFCSGMCEK